MQRSIFVLAAGGALLAIGFGLFMATAASIGQKVQEGSTPLALLTIGPQQEDSVDWTIGDTSQPLYIILSNTDDLNSLFPTHVPIDAEIEGPDGNVVLSVKDALDKILKLDPAMTGKYLLRLTNTGNDDTQIMVTLTYAPIPTTVKETFDQAGPAIAGIFVIMIGIPMIIAGAILFVVDRKKAKSNSISKP